MPGDLIRLPVGMLVPVDAWLLSAGDLHVQQSALTGELMPAEKPVALSSSAALTTSTFSWAAPFRAAATNVFRVATLTCLVAPVKRRLFGTVMA